MAFLRRRRFWTVALVLALSAAASTTLTDQRTSRLIAPEPPIPTRGSAPERFDVQLETNQGVMVIEVHRAWAPHGVERFYYLVRLGYYDDTRFFRVVANRWAQFGINGTPAVSQAWRDRTIPDDPRVESNVKGTVAFAFAVPDGRTTQVFINLQDNSETHDKEPFVPFGRITRGLEIIDRLNSEYGDSAGGGIRAGKQAPLFDLGNAYLDEHFPRLDRIIRATVQTRGAGSGE
jgi:homoserine O-acetyltransferase